MLPLRESSGKSGLAMITPKQKTRPKKNGGKPEGASMSAKTEFRIFGEEMIEKKVKTSGKTGRVYLPGDWVGKQVKIIRID
jgi:hypothetical protein